MRNKETPPEGKTTYEKMLDALSLPKVAAGVATSVSITGMSDITVEGYRGIIQYSDSMVCLNAPKYIIKITGCDLEIKEMATEYISIRGIIFSVEYTR